MSTHTTQSAGVLPGPADRQTDRRGHGFWRSASDAGGQHTRVDQGKHTCVNIGGRSRRHWKSCFPQGTVGSNPTLSAESEVGAASPFTVRQEFALIGDLYPVAFGSDTRWMSISKSMALMIPSPNISWITALMLVPYTWVISCSRYISGSTGRRRATTPLWGCPGGRPLPQDRAQRTREDPSLASVHRGLAHDGRCGPDNMAADLVSEFLEGQPMLPLGIEDRVYAFGAVHPY